MTFLSKQTLSASAGIALLVGLYGSVETGKELNWHYNSGDVTTLSGRLVVAVDCARLFRMLFYKSCGRTSKVRPGVDTINVDKSGSGDTTTVQEAVDAVMDGNKKQVTIHIAAETYNEKVLVPSNKPYITFQGSGLDRTIITWNDNAYKKGSTYKTASVAIEADHFIARNINFKNTAPIPGPEIIGAQAIALQVVGDKCAFYDCGVYGYRDTLSDDQGRHYFQECRIE